MNKRIPFLLVLMTSIIFTIVICSSLSMQAEGENVTQLLVEDEIFYDCGAFQAVIIPLSSSQGSVQCISDDITPTSTPPPLPSDTPPPVPSNTPPPLPTATSSTATRTPIPTVTPPATPLVTPTPPDSIVGENLILNPLFMDDPNPRVGCGFEHWVEPDIPWTCSTKGQPSLSAEEGGDSSSRMNTGVGSGANDPSWPVGADGRLYQVVAVDPAYTELYFGFWSVEHGYDFILGEVYGSNSPDGPWVKVADLFDGLPRPDPDPPGQGNDWIWYEVDATFGGGYNYLKLQFHGKTGDSDDAWKFTAVEMWVYNNG